MLTLAQSAQPIDLSLFCIIVVFKFIVIEFIVVVVVQVAHSLHVYINHQRLYNGQERPGALRQLIAFVIGCSGGSVLVAFLLADVLPVFSMNTFPIYIITWALFSLSKQLRVLVDNPIISGHIGLLATASNAICICGGVKMALRAAPGEYILAIVCGLLAGSGGGVSVDLFRLTQERWGFDEGVSSFQLCCRLAPVFGCALFHTIISTIAGEAQLSLLMVIVVLSSAKLRPSPPSKVPSSSKTSSSDENKKEKIRKKNK